MDVNLQSIQHRTGHKSVLHGTAYRDLINLNLDKIWAEIEENCKIIIKFFNAITSKTADQDPSMKVKYCFVYAILMNARWSEFSLLQRVNTVLVIEGGCSKKVINKSLIQKYYLIGFVL